MAKFGRGRRLDEVSLVGVCICRLEEEPVRLLICAVPLTNLTSEVLG